MVGGWADEVDRLNHITHSRPSTHTSRPTIRPAHTLAKPARPNVPHFCFRGEYLDLSVEKSFVSRNRKSYIT